MRPELALDAVEQLPVGPQHRLGLGEQRLLVGAVEQRLDQGALLRRVLDVERRVQVEVHRRVAARLGAVVGDEALALGLGDRRLRRLDRVHRDERVEQRALAVAGPGGGAGGRLGRRGGAGVAADGGGEAVPELDVRGLLGGVAAQGALQAGRRRRRPRRSPTPGRAR